MAEVVCFRVYSNKGNQVILNVAKSVAVGPLTGGERRAFGGQNFDSGRLQLGIDSNDT